MFIIPIFTTLYNLKNREKFNCSVVIYKYNILRFYLYLTVSAELMPWHGRESVEMSLSSPVKLNFLQTGKQVNASFGGGR